MESMKLSMQWFYGRDLRSLTDEELKQAFEFFAARIPIKSRLCQMAYQDLIRERNRRGYKSLKEG